MEFPYISVPGKQANFDWAAIPNADMTAVTTKDHYVFQICLSNTNNADATVTIQNAGGTVICGSVPVVANSISVIAFPRSTKFVGGLSWQASTTGINGEIKGFTIAA